MPSPFMDKWELNGTEVLLQDEGRDKANGVPILDENAKLPLKYITPAYSENLKVSPNDPYNMTFLDWAKTISSEAFRNPGRGWSKSANLPETQSNFGIAYANGIWVASSTSFTYEGAYWSEDGLHWNTISALSDSRSEPVYINGRWFVWKAHGLATSVNGKSWSVCTNTETLTSHDTPIYDNNLFLCRTSDGLLYWSEDGVVWNSCQGIASSSPTIQNDRPTPVYANGVWLYCNFIDVYASTNGKTWTLQTTKALRKPEWTGSIWLARGVTYGVWWSNDNGVTWNASSGLDNRYEVVDLAKGANVYVCCMLQESSNEYGLCWSSDGKTWTGCTGDYTQGVATYCTYADGVFIACAVGHVIRSTDGKVWTNVLNSAGRTPIRLNGLWFVFASVLSEGIWCSENGIDWISGLGESVSVTFNRIAYGDDIWVATLVDPRNYFLYSGGKAWLPTT